MSRKIVQASLQFMSPATCNPFKSRTRIKISSFIVCLIYHKNFNLAMLYSNSTAANENLFVETSVISNDYHKVQSSLLWSFVLIYVFYYFISFPISLILFCSIVFFLLLFYRTSLCSCIFYYTILHILFLTVLCMWLSNVRSAVCHACNCLSIFSKSQV